MYMALRVVFVDGTYKAIAWWIKVAICVLIYKCAYIGATYTLQYQYGGKYFCILAYNNDKDLPFQESKVDMELKCK